MLSSVNVRIKYGFYFVRAIRREKRRKGVLLLLFFLDSFEPISVLLTRLASPTREWNEQNVFFVGYTWPPACRSH